jgi:hypothetical protein
MKMMSKIVTHFLSPNPFENGTPRVTWQDSEDTSKIWGLTIASVVVDPTAIPWLLVQVVGAETGPTGKVRSRRPDRGLNRRSDPR